MAFVPVAAGLTRLGRDSKVSTLARGVVYSRASSPSTPSCLTAGVSRFLPAALLSFNFLPHPRPSAIRESGYKLPISPERQRSLCIYVGSLRFAANLVALSRQSYIEPIGHATNSNGRSARCT